jgi:CRISPR/Cas system-associated protein Csx1
MKLRRPGQYRSEAREQRKEKKKKKQEKIERQTVRDLPSADRYKGDTFVFPTVWKKGFTLLLRFSFVMSDEQARR